MKRTITRLFDTHTQALAVVDELEAAGVPHDDISIIANNADSWHDGHKHPDGHGHGGDTVHDAAGGAGKGAMLGGALGGAAGLLAGLGLLVIPGVGPVAAAGWLAATATGALTGAVAGGATGGLLGALKDAGETGDNAQVYAEGVRRGGSIVSVRIGEDDSYRVMRIFDANRGVAAEDRGQDYRGEGWAGFDESADPYTPDQASAERSRYGDIDLEPERGEGRSFVNRDDAPTGGMSQDDTDAPRPASDWMSPGISPRQP